MGNELRYFRPNVAVPEVSDIRPSQGVVAWFRQDNVIVSCSFSSSAVGSTEAI